MTRCNDGMVPDFRAIIFPAQPPMDISQVMQRLQSVFDKVFAGPVKLTSETSAKDVSDWDSLTHVVLVVAVEQEFKIRFSLGEVEKLRNVGDFSDLILTRVSECQP